MLLLQQIGLEVLIENYVRYGVAQVSVFELENPTTAWI